MYFPKTQIKTNLYTNGGEFYLSTDNSPYIGYYYKLSNGNYYTGKTPQDQPNIRLTLISTNPDINLSSNNIIITNYADGYPIDFSSLEYPLYKEKSILNPTYNPNIPINNDYQIGEYRRFFCKKINEILYIEINKDYYTKLLNNDSKIAYQYYIPFNIPWKLTGNKEQVYKVNKNIVELTMKQQKLPSFNKYLQEDYTKYYK